MLRRPIGCALAILASLFVTGLSADGAELITPTSVTLDASVPFYPAINLINNSGLSGTATLANYTTITHPTSTNINSWVTNNPNGSGDYYLNGSPIPVMTFALDGPFQLTNAVLWNYAIVGNATKTITLSFSTTGTGGTFGSPVTLTAASTASIAQTLNFLAPANANAVRVTFDDNYCCSGGGDRVGLNEFKLIGTPLKIASTTDNWNTGASWLSAGEPSASHRVLVGGGFTTTISDAGNTADSLVVGHSQWTAPQNGSGTLNIAGAGAALTVTQDVVLGANSTTGNLNITSGGRLNVGTNLSTAAGGVGNVVIDNGTLGLSNGSSVSPNLAINSGGATFNVDSGNAATISGTLSGAGGINKTGAGTLALSGLLNYSGTTAVSQGTLQLTRNASFPGGAGTTGQFGAPAQVTVESGATLHVTGNWALGSGLTTNIHVNGGTLRFSNNDNYQGRIELTGGNIIATPTAGRVWRTGNWGDGLITVNPSANESTITGELYFVGTPSATKTTFNVANGAADRDLVFSAVLLDHPGFEGAMTLQKTGDGKMVFTGGGHTFQGPIVVDAGTVEFSGGFFNGTPFHRNMSITANAGGTILLSGAHSLGGSNLDGNNRLIINGGTLTVNAEQYLREGTGANAGLTLTSGTVNGSNELRATDGGSTIKVNASSNASTIAARMATSFGNFTFDVDNGSASTDLQVSGNIVGGFGVNKIGAGKMITSGANTYVGATNINAGQFIVDGTHGATGPGAGNYNIASGATLGGDGVIYFAPGAMATVSPNPGIVSPGPGYSGTNPANSADVGTLTLVGTGTVLDMNGILQMDIVSPTEHDVLNIVGGSIDIDPAALLSINGTTDISTIDFKNDLGFDAHSFVVLLNAAAINGNFANILVNQEFVDAGGNTIFFGNNGTNLYIGIVPEPASFVIWGVIGLVAVCGGWRKFKNRRM